MKKNKRARNSKTLSYKKFFNASLLEVKGKSWRDSMLLLVIHCMIITILTLVISRFITNFSASAAFGEKTIDYSMSDMYNTVTNRRAVRYLSNDIVIVATDNCSRIDIANIILEVNKYAPLAVGIDIFFPYEAGNDSSILFALNNCQNLVLPMQLPDSTKPQNNNFSFFDGLIDANYGFVNLELFDIRSTLRNYHPYDIFENETIPNFAVALAKHKNKKATEYLQHRNNNEEIIYYPSVEFNIISGREIIDNRNIDSCIFTNKIVILGDINNLQDMFLTPLNKAMPGVLLHAYITHTIISEKFITVSREWINWLFAIIICLLIVFAKLYCKKTVEDIDEFLTRIIQFFIMYILFVIGCLAFAYHDIYIDFTLAILMIALSAVIHDLWFGVYTCYLKVKLFIKNRKS